MIDVFLEDMLPLRIAATKVPKVGKKPTHTSTLFRWSTAGIRGVVLETMMIGGTRCTSMEALSRFFNGVTEATAKKKKRKGSA